MPLATILIPVSPQHWETGIYHEAVASATAQTFPTAVLVQRDEQGRGASWARNTGMQQVKTPFVVYLDADDLVGPDFVERTIQHYRPGHYVYTDYRVNGQLIPVPDVLNIWQAGQQHITPTLLPVGAWVSSGGFDESLDTLEDEDFYRKLHAYGWCGARCPGALIEYRRNKGNSQVNRDRHDLDRVHQRVAEKMALFEWRYRDFMACGCKDNAPQIEAQQAVGNAPGANMVLAKALYSPMRKMGPVSGTLYDRQALGAVMWVDMDDVAAKPEWWQKVANNPVSASPDPAQVQALVKEARAAAMTAAPRPGLSDSFVVDGPDYNALTVTELRNLASERGLALPSKARKQELVDALRTPSAQPA